MYVGAKTLQHLTREPGWTTAWHCMPEYVSSCRGGCRNVHIRRLQWEKQGHAPALLPMATSRWRCGCVALPTRSPA